VAPPIDQRADRREAGGRRRHLLRMTAGMAAVHRCPTRWRASGAPGRRCTTRWSRAPSWTGSQPPASSRWVSAISCGLDSAGRSASDIEAVGGWAGSSARLVGPGASRSPSWRDRASWPCRSGRSSRGRRARRAGTAGRRRRPRSRGGTGIRRRSRAPSCACPRPSAGGSAPATTRAGGRRPRQPSTRGPRSRSWAIRQ